MSTLSERFEAAIMPTYGAPPVALVEGAGCSVLDADGNRYLDFIAGIAVSSLGHAHPALVRAVSEQVGRIAHSSNLFVNEPSVALAERLLRLLGHPGKVFLANSGTEANEAALKLAKLHGASKGRNSYVVAADSGFHGRSMGALSLTGKASIREPFGPFGTDVTFVPYGEPDALDGAVTSTCSAVFLEPIQGEAGVVPPPTGYLKAARQICDSAGALLVLDEIQSGIGRTGQWFAHTTEDVVPDVITVAKGLGGGLPIGACIGLGEAGDLFSAGDHGSTFGGNPVAAAAALAVLDTIEQQNLLGNAATVGALLAEGLAATEVTTVRGKGLWLGVVLRQPNAAAVAATARRHGFLINPVRPDVIRIAPPLVVSVEEAQLLVDAFPAILAEADSGGAA